MKTRGQTLAIPGTKWFDDLPLHRKAPVLYWVTFAIVVAHLCLPVWNLDMWAAWIGWFAIPVLAQAYAFWSWNPGLRLARKKKSRELMRAAQERFGLARV
jgi:hypothetical protein